MTIQRQRQNGAVPVLAAVALAALVVAAFVDQPLAFAAAHEAPVLLAAGVFVSRFGLSGYMLILSAATVWAAVLVLRRTKSPRISIGARRIAERGAFFFAAIAASGLLCQLIKHLVGRARPRFLATVGAFHLAGPTLRSGYESFPSGHSTTAFAAAMAFYLFRPAWGMVSFPAAVVICVSRIFAEAHYPSDTVAGALLGSLVTLRLSRIFAERDVAFPVPDARRRPIVRRLSGIQSRGPT